MGAFILYVIATDCLFLYFHGVSYFIKNVLILQYNLEIDMHALDALCVNTPGVWSSI